MASFFEGVAEIAVRLGIVRLESDCLPICGNRFLDPAKVFEDISQGIESVGAPRVEEGDMLIAGQGFVEPPLAVEAVAEIDMGIDKTGLQGNGLLA